MTLDPQIQPIVDLVNAAALEAPPVADQTAEMRREGYAALVGHVPPGPDMAVRDMVAPGPAGDIPLRIYEPSPASGGVLVFYHGGGFCIGTLDTHDEQCRQLAARSGARVVSVDYRLGPEHRFPAAVDDSWAALEWVAAKRTDLGVAADAPIGVGGDSAGGNLAAVMALLARDVGLDLAVQLLVYPVVDQRAEAHDRFASRAANGAGYVLTTEAITWFADHYFAADADRADVRASPLLAPSLAGVAPAVVATAEFDPLRDEGIAYAEALRAAGVDATHADYAGMVHVFFQLGPGVDTTVALLDDLGAAARRHLGEPS
ncbi:MAG: alpha/beta hydrolase [Actinomycetota bacterium]